MIVFPIFTEHGHQPHYIVTAGIRSDYEGCLASDKLQRLSGEGHFFDRITKARNEGAFKPKPGLWIALDLGDGKAEDVRGMIFTITEDGSLKQGPNVGRVPRLTTWPPKS